MYLVFEYLLYCDFSDVDSISFVFVQDIVFVVWR